MSPKAEIMLLNEIMPIIKGTVPHTVKPVGSEDHEEIIQDTVVMAASMVDSAERNGQKLIPKSIAYFAIQSAKSGRRSTYAGRSDVMSAAAQNDSNAFMQSMDEALYPGDDADDMTLGNMLACKRDDPATLGARNLDWAEFMKTQNKRAVGVVVGMAQGKMTKDIAREHLVSPPRVVQLKRKIAMDIQQSWGDQVMAQAASKPAWRQAMDNRKW